MAAADQPQVVVGNWAGSCQLLPFPVPGIVGHLIITLLHSPREEGEGTGDFGGSWLGWHSN